MKIRDILYIPSYWKKIVYEEGTNELYNDILNSRDITQKEYDMIEKRKK